MDWTPEAKEAFKAVPPAVQKIAKIGVESYARKKGMGTVTIEVIEEARTSFMGGGRKKKDRKTDLNTGLNIGVNKRHTMHLANESRYLANETGDPLHEAFDYKMSVHAMPRGGIMQSEKLCAQWDQVMSDRDGLPMRTIYIHIPFCHTHCIFCGFHQNVYNRELAEKYVDYLIREIKITASASFSKARPFQAVYIGGGTPTALSASSIEKLAAAVKNYFPLANDCEFTLEGRIYNFTKEKFEAALSSGINRFSLGIQTFDTEIRKRLGRIEPKEKIVKALRAFNETGKAVVIIDMIYGLPGQTINIFKEDIKTFLSLELSGCDLYQLNVFQGGPLDKAVEKKTIHRPAALREQADYFALGVELMEKAHYRRLSTAHWARTSRERSLYNSFSRGRSECIPLGAGAGGWLKNPFFFVQGDLKEYFKALDAGKKPLSMGMKRPAEDLLFRDISYQMELGYCDLKDLSDIYHKKLIKILDPVVSQWERVKLVTRSNGCIYLTRAGEFWAVNLAQILIDILQAEKCG